MDGQGRFISLELKMMKIAFAVRRWLLAQVCLYLHLLAQTNVSTFKNISHCSKCMYKRCDMMILHSDE